MSSPKDTADASRLTSTGPEAPSRHWRPCPRARLSTTASAKFKLMVEKKASDLFFTSNAPIKIKIEGQILSVNKQVLTPETVKQTAYALMTNEQREHFDP